MKGKKIPLFDAAQKTFRREVSQVLPTPGFHDAPAHSLFCQINNSGLQLAVCGVCTGAVQDPALCYRQIQQN